MINKDKDIFNSGKLYDANDYQIDQLSLIQKVNEFNLTESSLSGLKKRTILLKEMFASCGDNVYIEPPFHASWGGKHVYLGDYVYINFNLTLIDDAHIYIGNRVLIGPNVTLVTAAHPLSSELRSKGLQYNKPIYVEDDVWIGANVIVLPGIRIGKGSVIGAGSVVTKDIKENSLVYGNPAKVIREITKDDDIYFDHNKKIKEYLDEKLKI